MPFLLSDHLKSFNVIISPSDGGPKVVSNFSCHGGQVGFIVSLTLEKFKTGEQKKRRHVKIKISDFKINISVQNKAKTSTRLFKVLPSPN